MYWPVRKSSGPKVDQKLEGEGVAALERLQVKLVEIVAAAAKQIWLPAAVCCDIRPLSAVPYEIVAVLG